MKCGLVLNKLFIALIHPIQWTIALPVGATGPAKRQKKMSCMYYRQDRSRSVHSPGGALYFLPVETSWRRSIFFVFVLAEISGSDRRNFRVNQALLLLTISGMGPQTWPGKNQLIRNFLRSLVTERLSEAWGLLWAGIRFLNSTVCLQQMTIPLLVPESNQPEKSLSSCR